MKEGGGGGGKCVFGWVLGIWRGWEGSDEPRGEKKDKKKDKLLLAPLSPHPCDVPFPSGGLEDTDPPPVHTLSPPTTTTTTLCYRSHTCQPRSASQSPAHGQMAWPWPGPTQMTQRGVGMIMKRITSGY